MANRYFFDKRDMKKGFLKYFIIFLVAFVPMVLFNMFVLKYISHKWLRVLIDCVILLVFVVIGNILANKIYERKDAKLKARIKAREEMESRKKKILEDSYKKKREEKLKKKAEVSVQDEIVIEVEDNENKENKTEEKPKKKITRSK